MKDIYVVVPRGTDVLAAADNFQRAAMTMAGQEDAYEVHNVDLLEEGD